MIIGNACLGMSVSESRAQSSPSTIILFLPTVTVGQITITRIMITILRFTGAAHVVSHNRKKIKKCSFFMIDYG